jgi:hypothetical protein
VVRAVLFLLGAATIASGFAARASADVGLYPVTKVVPSGGIEGETIRVTARPLGRTVRMTSHSRPRRFLVSEPAGVILLLRMTVPHGMRATATGSLSGIAGVRISTAHRGCRRRGAVDICTQPEEWCPMPAAVWRFRLAVLDGSAGEVRLDFVVGSPPR